MCIRDSILHINVVINWQLSKQGPADQYHLTESRAQVSTHRGRVFFEVIGWQVTSFQMIAGLSLIFSIHMKYVVFYMCRTIKISNLISNWPRKLRFSQFLQAGKTCQLLLTFLTKVTRWSRSTSNFYALIGQNLTVEFMQKIYAASWNLFTLTAEAGRVLCQLVMFLTVFPLNIVQNEIQLLSRVFCYSWLVCLSGFWLRNTSLVKVGNPISDGIVFVFHLAWCVRGLRSLKRFLPYLIVFSASRMVSLSHYFIWCLFFISNSMKSSAVYGAI